MKRSLNRWLFFAGFLVAALTMSACSKSPSSSQNQQSSGQSGSNASGTTSGAAGAAGASGAQSAQQTPPVPQPVTVTIPAGTRLTVVMDQSVSSAASTVGDRFNATLAHSVVIGGKTALPRGAKMVGAVTNAVSSGRLSTPAELGVTLKSVRAYGSSYQIGATPISMKGKSHKNRNIAIIGGSAAGGALIGGLLGHGKGAAIGALAGGGGGTAGAAMTGKSEITIGAETRLTFTLTQPVTVTLPPSQPSQGNAAASTAASQ